MNRAKIIEEAGYVLEAVLVGLMAGAAVLWMIW